MGGQRQDLQEYSSCFESYYFSNGLAPKGVALWASPSPGEQRIMLQACVTHRFDECDSGPGPPLRRSSLQSHLSSGVVISIMGSQAREINYDNIIIL